MNVLLLCTKKGRKYTRRIAEEIRLKNHSAFVYFCTSINLAFEKHPEWNKDNLIIHSRCAHPKANWMDQLEDLEQKGYRVINKTSVLKFTSDKFKSANSMADFHFFDPEYPKTFLLSQGKIPNEETRDEFRTEFVVIKPRYSQGGGTFVTKLKTTDLNNREKVFAATNKFTCSSVVQEFIPYSGIARVFCINGHAIKPITFDLPTENDWKVSVCLNQKQTPWVPIWANERGIKEYAEEIQTIIGGEINFIDVFWAKDRPILSEINTACSLLTHERITKFNIAESIASYLIS